MLPSQKAVDLISFFEGLSLTAYPDPGSGNEPITIGYGTTIYDDGAKVKLGDVITKERAKELLAHEVNKKAAKVNDLLTGITINQNQFDAIVSFAYNVGTGALQSSTLLKRVKANPNDPDIRNQFSKWVKAGGRTLPGLVKRRQAESELYFTPLGKPFFKCVGFSLGK